MSTALDLRIFIWLKIQDPRQKVPQDRVFCQNQSEVGAGAKKARLKKKKLLILIEFKISISAFHGKEPNIVPFDLVHQRRFPI